MSGVDFILLFGTIVIERVIQTQLLTRQVHLSFHFKWLIVTGVGYRCVPPVILNISLKKRLNYKGLRTDPCSTPSKLSSNMKYIFD